MDKYLSNEEFRGLINSIDCYISLHRSEGLGLGMAEAMFLNKPVIATGYSGNLEFMNEYNSFLVPYELIHAKESEYIFGGLSRWAEPNINEAAKYMVYLYENPELGKKMGQAAGTYMRKYHSKKIVSNSLLNRFNIINTIISK
jgi:glycosyltransferase involved in cell wall biosynthesis